MPQHAWRNRTETSQPHCALHYTWLHLSMSYTSAVFYLSFTLLSSLPFVCFQLHHQNKHIIRGLVDGSEQVVTFFLNPLPHVIFLCICVTVICPLSFCVVHFFPLYADFFVTTFDSKLWWHSTPWSASRPKRHCTAYMCACVFVCVRGRACLFFQMHDILCMCDNQRLFFLLHLSQYCWVS